MSELMLHTGLQSTVARGTAILHLEDAAERRVEADITSRCGIPWVLFDRCRLMVWLTANIRYMQGKGLCNLLLERYVPTLRNPESQIWSKGGRYACALAERGVAGRILLRSCKRRKWTLAGG